MKRRNSDSSTRSGKNGASSAQNTPPRAHSRNRRPHAQQQQQQLPDTTTTTSTSSSSSSEDNGDRTPYAPSGVEIVTLFEDAVLQAPRDVQLRGLWERILDEHAGEADETVAYPVHHVLFVAF